MNFIDVRKAVRGFLAEDIGLGDLTSDTLFTEDQSAEAVFLAKEDFIVSGIESIAVEVFHALDSSIHISTIQDGCAVTKGTTLLTARGPVRTLLQAERVALNLAQRLSGIATLTRQFVDKVAAFPVRIVDTRKTTPGLRMFEKYAVRTGGGHNHRFNLADGILIKDNHIAACGSIGGAVEKVRNEAPHTLKIEVEVESLSEVQECLNCGADIIMLDNMDVDTMRRAVAMVAGQAIVEASGGVCLENVRNIAETGVDIISIGALTHSARACDISMRLQGIPHEEAVQE